MKKYALIIIVPVMVIAAVLIWLKYGQTGNTIRTVKLDNFETEEITAEEPPKAAYDPISIPAFAAKELDGQDFQVGRVLEKNEAYTRYFITYESASLTISGIINVPVGEGPFPVLFLNHGYIDPAVYTNGRGLKREQDYLARQGYLIVHSDYRNHAQSDKEADPKVVDLRFGYAEDVANGITALKKAALPYADTSRIGMLGHSMGGGVAEIIAVAKPDLVDAIVLFAPVSADQKDNYEKWTKEDEERNTLTVERFGKPEDNPDVWNNASPINFWSSVRVPLLFEHGTADKDVPLEWSERAVASLQAAGKDVKLETYPGEGHEFAAAWPTVMGKVTAFFDKYVKNMP